MKMNNIWLKCRNIIFFQPTCANVLFRGMCTSKIMWWVLLQRHRQKYQTHKSLVSTKTNKDHNVSGGTASKHCNQVEKKEKTAHHATHFSELSLKSFTYLKWVLPTTAIPSSRHTPPDLWDTDRKESMFKIIAFRF